MKQPVCLVGHEPAEPAYNGECSTCMEWAHAMLAEHLEEIDCPLDSEAIQ